MTTIRVVIEFLLVGVFVFIITPDWNELGRSVVGLIAYIAWIRSLRNR
jgi:hypothetical protein